MRTTITPRLPYSADPKSTAPRPVEQVHPETSPTQSPRQTRDLGVWYAVVEGLRGSAIGFASSMAASLILRRYSTTWREVTFPGKAMAVSVVTMGSGVIWSEHAIYRYNRPQLYDYDDRIGFRKRASVTDDQVTLLWQYRWQGIAAATFGSLFVALWWMDRTKPLLSWSQKFMNARLWAQTIGISGIMAVLAAASKQGRE